MMAYLPLVLSALTGLILGLLFSAPVFGVLLFLFLGVAGHFLGRQMPLRSERVYWIGLGALLALIIVNMLGLSIHRYLLIAPLIIMAGHFASRTASRFLGRAA